MRRNSSLLFTKQRQNCGFQIGMWRSCTKGTVGGPIGCEGAFAFSAGLTSNVFLGPLARQRFSLQATRTTLGFMSSTLFQDMIKDTQAPVIRFYEDLLSRGLLKAVIAGPPPQEHHIASKIYGAKLFDMISAHQAPVRQALAGRCPIIEVQNVADARGYLLPAYWSSDPSHANAAYGALVVKALRETLG